jgi:hypothetical protein
LRLDAGLFRAQMGEVVGVIKPASRESLGWLLLIKTVYSSYPPRST